LGAGRRTCAVCGRCYWTAFVVRGVGKCHWLAEVVSSARLGFFFRIKLLHGGIVEETFVVLVRRCC